MQWLEIKIRTTVEACDAVSEMLMSLGAGGVVIEDPEEIRKNIALKGPMMADYVDNKLLEPQEEGVTLRAYFDAKNQITATIGIINEKLKFISNFMDTGEGLVECSEVNDENWAEAWKKYYTAFNISNLIVVKPSWEEYSPKEDEIVISIDPGMAFGTGMHETTRMCAQLLEKYVKPGCSVIDVGTGTGILAIIAAKLGAGNVKALDTDEVAVRAVIENSKINDVEGLIDVYAGRLDNLPAKQADIVVANIVADVVIEILSILPAYLKKDGVFIASGIIRQRRKDVEDTGIKNRLFIEEIKEQGEWMAMVFKWRDSL